MRAVRTASVGSLQLKSCSESFGRSMSEVPQTADESPAHFNFSPETLGGGTSRMIVIVDDPDAACEQAVAAGAKVVWPVSDQSYGWRVGRIGKPLTGT
jgi:uncharacterized glyoxalase superfamily protein PhnB